MISRRSNPLVRDPEDMHCRVIMKNGKLLAPMPKLAPPPRDWTLEERRVEKGGSRERVRLEL